MRQLINLANQLANIKESIDAELEFKSRLLSDIDINHLNKASSQIEKAIVLVDGAAKNTEHL